MLRLSACCVVASALTFMPALAQTPAQPATRVTADAVAAQEAANKALVVDFWYRVVDAQDVGKARDYIAMDYIQHNPNLAGGLQGFIEYFRRIWPTPKGAEAIVKTQFTAVLAEGDLVQLVSARPRPEPADPTKTYQSYWFDLFRVKDGKIVEHWDAALKPPKN